MKRVTVSDKALREMIREAMFGSGGMQDLGSDPDGPVNVNAIVDPSAAVTDPVNPSFTPQSKTEFGIAINQLVKDLPDTEMPALYDTVRTVIDQKERGDEESEAQVAAMQAGNQEAIDDAKREKHEGKQQMKPNVEEALRQRIRKLLAAINPRWNAPKAMEEAWSAKKPKEFGPVVGPLPPVKKIPAGEHGAEYLRHREKYQGDLKKLLKKPLEEPVADDAGEEADTEFDAEGQPRKRAYKSTAIGGMADVDYDEELGDSKPKSFQEIAKELGFSVPGAKQAVDKALSKAQFLQAMDDDDREIFVLNAMNDYIEMLNRSGELTSADVQLMKDHPDVVRDLDGFREYLHNAVRRKRKGDTQVIDPLEEPSGREVAAAVSAADVPAGEAVPTLKRSKDTYKVYPGKGKSSVVRVGGKLYGTGAQGALPDGKTTQFKGGERAKVAAADGKVTVTKTDGDHAQTWDPVQEGVLLDENTAAMVRKRKEQRPDLYCKNCLWMTGGGQCPRHGGEPWTPERQKIASAKSRGVSEGRFTGRNLRGPGSIANLVRLFRERYPSLARQEAEPRILKRWLTYCQRGSEPGEIDPQQEAQILRAYLDQVWPEA